MNKIACFGELLLRFSPQMQGQWLEECVMPVYVGGAELNVAIALASWDQPVKFITAVPRNTLTSEIINGAHQKKIDTSGIHFSGNRIGLYYLPQGADLKNAGVIYDRLHSSFSELEPGQLDWETILTGVSWFHLSAINPALNKNLAMVCKEALEVAERKNIFISIDLNYREKLWQYGKTPLDIMPELVQHCNLVMGNIWAAEKMLGISHSMGDGADKLNYVEQSEKTSREIIKNFSRCEQVANTFRFNKNEGIDYYATLFQDNQLYVSEEKHVAKVVDRVGSGDCFMAGLIYGNNLSYSPQQTIDFAVLAAVSKLNIKGDATTLSVSAIKNLMHDK